MKLKSIKIFPQGKAGWGSELLQFGEHITQLFGPNGCGKTPVVQSIAYCLGYPCIFRHDIYNHCSHVVLNVDTEKGILKIKRIYSKDVDIEVIEPTGSVERFLNEADYSNYLLEWLGFSIHNLVSNRNTITTPYLATILPIFYLDQDNGYSNIYCPPSNFIKDQFSEMMRMIFGLPVKNSFDAKKEKIKAKRDLDFLDRKVELQARKVESAKNNTEIILNNSDQLTEQIENLESELEYIKSSGATHDDSINVFDRLIAVHKATMKEYADKIIEIEKRSNSINQIVHEIHIEIETLNLNEESRRIFLSFNEICGSGNCQLFSSSSDSYSKNLLYLKDQIKDLERNTVNDGVKCEELKLQKSNLESVVQIIVDERNKIISKSEVSALVVTISEIKNHIFELQTQRSDIEKIELLEKQHFKIIIDRNKALSKYQEFSTERASIPELIKLRADLRQYLLVWLEDIHTSNIDRAISFSGDFVPHFGVETISQLKGSTRIRAVLAYHAAILELMVKNENSRFGFLILDTPKQHEIHIDDLDRYLKALKSLSMNYGIQIVFSTTEYHYEGDELDAEWNPPYPGEEQSMFLEQVSNKLRI